MSSTRVDHTNTVCCRCGGKTSGLHMESKIPSQEFYKRKSIAIVKDPSR